MTVSCVKGVSILSARGSDHTDNAGAVSERTFTAVIYKEKDIFVAECPEVGTVSQSYSL
jgi:hypothetical protein